MGSGVIFRRFAAALTFIVAAATWMPAVDGGQQPPTQDNVPASPQPATAGGSSILDGVFTATQATRGGREFQRACAACHDVSEQTGRRFAAKWAGTTIGDVFELVTATMPEADPGSLQPSAYASILAFFLKESGYPEGAQDLSSDAEVLKRIRIEPLPK